MTQISNLAEAERILAGYIPQVRELLGKDLTLVRMQPMMSALGNPQDKLKIIHVAGTSGKTSTCYYLASLLAATGKRVGLTVSPHIDSITERIQINGQPISDTEFCDSIAEFLQLIEHVDPRPTYFELLIAFVYWYFTRVDVDYAVIETGLGGSFDATNIVTRSDKVCVITDIGFDHMKVLGHTISAIASQKSGIIQPGNQVFMYDQGQEVSDVFETKTVEQKATLHVLNPAEVPESIGEQTRSFQLLPLYQRRNWTLAKQVFDYVRQRDQLAELSPTRLGETMAIQIPGRMDVHEAEGKTIIMDGAHNEQKMRAFVDSFRSKHPDQKAAILLALKEGKEYRTVLPLLKPICSDLIITTFDTIQDLPAKSLDPALLATYAKREGIEKVSVVIDPEMAYSKLLETNGQLGIVTGSFYLLAVLRPRILSA